MPSTARPFRFLATALAAATLAGCSAPPFMQTSMDAEIRPGILGTFQYAAGGRDMLVVPSGNPFAMPDDAFAQALTATMRNNNNGPDTRFVPAPTDTTRPGFFVLAGFNPPNGYPTNRDCVAPPAQTAAVPAADNLFVTMVFCGSQTAMSWVIARGPWPDGPDDPRFVDLIQSSTRALIPTRDDDPGDFQD